ncbi:MAG TPA: hypothetical protein PLL78_06475 [Fimbriimonadaceae bacterium]|nr:hypothetical protein [Fimbriimonadaceae bacterium]HRJ96313.1 hypothetical protein [Fimbriimonadaceae bacterium]
MTDRRPIGVVALALALALLGGALSTTPHGQALLVIAGLLFVGAIVWAVRERRPTSRYDLGELRRIEEEEVLAAAGWEATDDADEIVCPNCGTIRESRLPICPNCRS